MIYINKKFRPGLTLIELVLAALIGIVISLIIGTLLYSGQKNWSSSFNRSNKGIEIDALDSMLTFGSFGRRSNSLDYAIYTADSRGIFARPSKPSVAGQVLTGNAVEFRYWDTPLNAILMNNAITATHYKLFYLKGKQLMVDDGPYPPGGVANFGTSRTAGNGVTTRVLADNVTSLEFSHTAKNTNCDGDGCVRMNMILTDPNDGRTITVKTATLLRGIWGATPAHN